MKNSPENIKIAKEILFPRFKGNKMAFNKWLKDSGLLTMPASLKYHLNYEGGLLEHSINVGNYLQELTMLNRLSWERPDSPMVIGLLHDMCKTVRYCWDEDTKQYKNNPAVKPAEHGDLSEALVRNAPLDVTEEELLCIRWHMGAFDAKENWSGYTNAVKENVNVLWTHMADMLASQIKER